VLLVQKPLRRHCYMNHTLVFFKCSFYYIFAGNVGWGLFVCFFFSMYLNCFCVYVHTAWCEWLSTLYVTAGCVYLNCRNICRMHGAASVCYRWNTQYIANVRGHTMSVHHLYKHDRHYTWPTVTNPEHWYVGMFVC